MNSGRCGWLIGLCCAASLAATAFAQEEDDELPPGLLGRYYAGDRTITQIDATPAFDWGTAQPDPRLPDGPFSARWTGRFLIRADGPHRFHAFVQGNIEVQIAGQVVLEGRQKTPGWISGPDVPLEFGEQPLEVEFHSLDEGPARLQLFWSSSTFPVEPLPANQLFHEAPEKSLAPLSEAADSFAAHRCNRCHQRENDPVSPAAPSLAGISSQLDRHWLVRWLVDPTAVDPAARMPSFGFSKAEAEAVADALSELPATEIPAFTPAPDDKQIAAGGTLFRSIGCLACHTHGKSGTQNLWSGGDLTRLREKRSPGWTAAWLKDPARLNPQHRMPQFALTDEEIRQLASFLDAPRDEPLPISPKAASQAERGRELIRAARCTVCHQIPGIEPDRTPLTDLSGALIADRSCLADQPDLKQHRPYYPRLERKPLQEFLASRQGTLAVESLMSHGARVLASQNCLNCHPRGTQHGLAATAKRWAEEDEALRGQSEALIPPSLNGVGDKLRDEILALAVAGEQPVRRLPWLRVRMPRFAHSPADRQALVAHFLATDRIPANPPPATALSAPVPHPSDTAADKSAQLVAGHALIGGKGFSCVACHKAGKFEPRNVALGTRGSDLLGIGTRMRREFFLRWLRAPLRIVHDMEMPGYEKPIPGILDGQLDGQLAAVWEGLNDPGFQPPLDPSVIEQLLTVAPDAQPRIVRDVFVLAGEKDRYVPRAFAVGFGNQHNLLFDLDTLTVRDWWLGDFARQRTQGKSWYWDAAGVRLASGWGTHPDFALIINHEGKQEVAFPQPEHGTAGRLRGYQPQDDGLQIQYQIKFAGSPSPHLLDLTETWTPLTKDQETGWQRKVSVPALPEGETLVLLRQPWQPLLGEIHTLSPDGQPPAWKSQPLPGSTEPVDVLPLQTLSGSKSREIVLHYLATAKPVQVEQPVLPAVPLQPEPITSVPGFDGIRLPIERSIMPTGIAWASDGTPAITSLKGHLYTIRDRDGDGVEEDLQLVEEGLAAPYGLIADGSDWIVAHKPELLRLRDLDGDGRTDHRELFATGWGFNDNYHDWTCGIVRNAAGDLFIGLGSDYAQKGRPQETTRWRGKVLQISPQGEITPVGHGFRYPTGLALSPAGQLFISDNQGVQNTFNEINWLVPGGFYGVPSLFEEQHDGPPLNPAIQLPHPWTRSVNGLFFLGDRFGPFAGHGIGCEYDLRFLVRFTFEQIGDQIQGAVYPFSKPRPADDQENFEGTLVGAASPQGEIWIGSIHDSGWLGGRNVGSLVKLRPNGQVPCGIREIRVIPDGFRVTFTSPIDPAAAAERTNYSLSAYTRVWQGAYATPDSDRRPAPVTEVQVAEDRLSVTLKVDRLRDNVVYDIRCGEIGPATNRELWPDIGHYTVNRLP